MQTHYYMQPAIRGPTITILSTAISSQDLVHTLNTITYSSIHHIFQHFITVDNPSNLVTWQHHLKVTYIKHTLYSCRQLDNF
jgi:hypothetical protein